MQFLPSLFSRLFYLNSPSAAGWLIFLCLLGFAGWLLRVWRKYQTVMDGRFWLVLSGLGALTTVTNLFLGIGLTAKGALPLPGLPVDESAAILMPLAAISWLIASGTLGPWGGALIAGFAGFLRAAFDTHSPFLPLEFAVLGMIAAASIRQRYRTPIYRLLRQPFVTALVLIPLRALLYLINTLTLDIGTLPARVDYALSHLSAVTLAFGGEIVVAGIVTQILFWGFPRWWGEAQEEPSPAETRLETRFLFWTVGFLLVLFATLVGAVWTVAGNSAREMFRERLSSAASTISQNIPFFLETGQNLVFQIASAPQALAEEGPALSAFLRQSIQSTPYFDQIAILSLDGTRIYGAYPASLQEQFPLYPEEQAALRFVAGGVLFQSYTLPPQMGEATARVSFISAIVDAQGKSQRVLIARTSLDRNPLIQPVLGGLRRMELLQGVGILVDQDNRILYHPNPTQIMQSSPYPLPVQEVRFFEQVAPDGTRQLVLIQPVPGRPWSVILAVPAQQAQQLALNIAAPLGVTLFFLTVVALVALRLGLRVMSASLQDLAREANRIAQGQLDHPLQVTGYDEIGQLSRSFEQMRLSLRARLDELNRLLRVSQGVASSLEMRDALHPVLEAVLDSGASAVRVVLSPNMLPETPVELPTRFVAGQDVERYAMLDERLLLLAQSQEKIILPNLMRGHPFSGVPIEELPAALLAVALQHEQRFYGVMWAAYDRPRNFSEADVRFISTLGGQAALAAANAHLFLTVEAGRRQLEAILNSSADPILVTDPQNRLFLANPAARQVLQLPLSNGVRPPIHKVIQQPVLLELLATPSTETRSAEVKLSDERTYLAIASAVVAEGRSVGRVCILRDVTYFKQLDALKSEFVATVSHDLRSPLTLMRGYATMLEMVGELNEQQQNYVRKIIMGVENMSRLVNNLLDLGRIELGVGLQVETIPIRDTVEHVISTLQLQATQKQIQLTLEVAPNLPLFMEADQALLHQALYNLVENALKYTPEGGRVTVRLRSEGDTVVFEIQDTGIGIAPSDLPRLFEKFYRARQREARAQHGSGLGLAIVRSIAEQHRGKVWVESELGKGSTFYLQIPLKQTPKT